MALDPEKLFAKDDPTKLYKLLEELAVGSYGRVYRAQDKKTNQICALKVIPLEENDALDDFLPEISIMKTTSHPNLVKFYGAWMKKRELFIAMELCGGGAGNDLYQGTGKALPEPVICLVIRETTKALAYCHENAIMHRDIKAANILFTESGDVKLTDFGVSCQMATPLERRKTYIGTPYWVAPEIIMVNCLSDDMQVLTEHGFMFVDQILRASSSDNTIRVAAYNEATQSFSYEEPSAILINPSTTQTMIEFSSAIESQRWSPISDDYGICHGALDDGGVSMLVTPNHDMYVRVGFASDESHDDRVSWMDDTFVKRRADQLHRLATLDRPVRIQSLARAIEGVAPCDVNVIPPYVAQLGIDTIDKEELFLEIYGCFLSSGTIVDSSHSACFENIKPQELEFICSALKILGIEYTEYTEHTSRTRLIITESSFYDLIVCSYDHTAKRMPLWIWSLGKQQVRALLRGLCRSNSINDDISNEIFTTSHSFRDELLQLCLHAGYTASFNATSATTWRVAFHDDDNQFITRPTLRGERGDVKQVSYTGRTWCVTVSTGLIITRRAFANSNGVITKASTPQVIGNCLFKPYDNKVDIWSLGITVIELAETKPPHFNLRATRAMMEIPRSPAPKLTQPGNWSTDMNDFVLRCTEKDPEKRWSAKQLCSHPWMSRACDRSVLADYIRQIKAAKKGAAELAASGPPAPSVSSSTAAALAAVPPPTAPIPVKTNNKSPSSPQQQGYSSSPNSYQAPPASPTYDSPAFDDDTQSDIAGSLRRSLRQDSKLNVDDLLRADRAAADRPVAKTRALTAQHDILIKRLQKQHIQELKKLLREHMKAQDLSQKEVDQQKPKSAAALIRKKEAVKDDEAAMAKEQISEREQLQRKQLKEMEQHIRTQGLERKQLLKELRDKQSGQASELAVYARGGEGNMKYQLELDALRLDYELALKHEAATHSVASQHLIELYALARTHYKRRRAAREEMLKKLQSIEYDHATSEQSVQLRFLQQTHARQRDLLELTHAKQREHMKKQQELASALHIREFRDECAKKDREWLRSREQESKGSAEIKRALKARQAQNLLDEERLYQRLMESLQGEHRREEDDQLAQHAKMKELQLAAQKRIEQALEKDHRDKLNLLNEEHKKQKLAFLQRSRKFQLDMLTEHQQGLLQALEELHRAQNNSTNEYFVHLKELKRKYALAIDFGESVSSEQIEVGKRLSEAQIEEKKRAIEQGAAAVQALSEQLDQEAGEFEMAISGDLLGTARTRTLTAGRGPQQAFTFGTARSATLSRLNGGPSPATGLPPSAATGLPGSLSPRGRSVTTGDEEDADMHGYRVRTGTDSVLLSRDSTPLSSLLMPQKFDPAAALRGPPARDHTTRPDSVLAPSALEPSRVTLSPEEMRKLAAAKPRNPLYEG